MLLPQRVRLACATTYTVDPVAGNDASDGTTAFKTIQGAINFVRDNVDACWFQVVIQCAPGTYHEGIVLGPVVGANPGGWPSKSLVIRGNVGDLTQCTIDAAAFWCFTAVNVQNGWLIEGFTLKSTAGIIESDKGSTIYFGTNCIAGNPQYGLAAIYGGTIEVVASYHIAPIVGGPHGQAHWFGCYSGLLILVPGIAVYLDGITAYAQAFAVSVDNSLLVVGGAGFAGSAVGGLKYSATQAGINAGGMNLPGDTAGVLGAGGWYT